MLDLVPDRFRNLAAPPSFESCTRDVYPEDTAFSFSTAIEYICQIAGAAAHLHASGIIHGDLYAHNILVDGGHALLSDFGAACLYRGHSELNGSSLERIEVRSLGILIQEIASRVTEEDRSTHSRALVHIEDLARACLDYPVANRLSCRELAEQLAAYRAD